MKHDFTQLNTSTAGYQCQFCGRWVSGTWHICEMGQGGSGNIQYLNPMVVIDNETKETLKRIADALERLADKLNE